MFKYIKNLPKAELHLHIEGTLEPRLMFKLAERNGINILYKDVSEVKKAYEFDSLQSFLDIYYTGASVLLKKEDFFELAWEYFKRCKEENIIHSEIFFDPQAHTSRGVSFSDIIEGLNQAQMKAEEEFGITSCLIMSFLRHLSEEEAISTLKESLPYKYFIKGVGLDSSETGNPPEKFEKVFTMARNAGYLCVAHAGEEGDSSYIWGALDCLHVKRIDHGVRCEEDIKLMEKLKNDEIPLTICPLSNVKLRVFKDMKEHNIKKLLDYGLLVTVNSDDPAYFGGYLNKNYEEITKALNLTKDDLIKLAKNSFKASFLSEEEKERYLERFDEI